MEDSSTGLCVEADIGDSDDCPSSSSKSIDEMSMSRLPVQNGSSAPTVPLNPALYHIHRAVYENSFRTLTKLVRQKEADLERKDMHGNTALHLAAILGRKECIQILLAYNAPVNVKNLQGQTPLNEAISFGNKEILKTMVQRLRQQTSAKIKAHRSDVENALTKIDDFMMKIKWEFHSWVPLVSRFLPSDICHVYKKGSDIRMDTTLVDFKDMKWERGNLSFLFNGKHIGSKSLLVMDHDAKVYQWLRDQSEEVIGSDVDLMMSMDNETGKMSTRDITFSRAHSGFIFKADKTELVGGCKADFYNVHGIKVISVKRREHLSEEDVKRNKAGMDQAGLQKALTEDMAEPPPRESLPAPPENTHTWKEYWTAEPGHPPCIGRPVKSKSHNKTFQATIAMSEDFPVNVDQILTVLESVKPLRHFSKLRDFLKCKLPSGFPVKLEIPVFPTVTARVAFEDFCWKSDLDDKFFEIPKGYREDRDRFSGL